MKYVIVKITYGDEGNAEIYIKSSWDEVINFIPSLGYTGLQTSMISAEGEHVKFICSLDENTLLIAQSVQP